MTGNIAPIYSRVADIQGGVFVNAAAAEYLGVNLNNQVVYCADGTNGGFVQRLRFKAANSVAATVARVYINNGNSQFTTSATAPTIGTGTPGTAGTLANGAYIAKVQGLDAYGAPTAFSAESAAATVATGTSNSISWAWTAGANCASYRIWVGCTGAGAEQSTYFTSTASPFVQTTQWGTNASIASALTNNILYGEVSLPAVTASSTTATSEIDYVMNLPLPPAYRIIVGVATAPGVGANGWWVSAIAGRY